MSRVFTPAEVRSLRREHEPPEAWRPIGVVEEPERSSAGIEQTVTVFLAGAQCPYSCLFCDLWRHTLQHPTPTGAIPTQIRNALARLKTPPQVLKLYNASNFFENRAVPSSDDSAILRQVSQVERLVVECHPHLVGDRALRYATELGGRLEIAMGLETSDADAHRRLGKGTTPGDFRVAATFMHEHDIDVRIFVLVGAPFIPRERQLDSVVATVRFAADLGARHVSLIPVRGGNGAIEALARQGHFHPPTLQLLETCFDVCLQDIGGTIASVDLWDLDLLSDCPDCLEKRHDRLAAMNLDGQRRPRAACDGCGAAPA